MLKISLTTSRNPIKSDYALSFFTDVVNFICRTDIVEGGKKSKKTGILPVLSLYISHIHQVTLLTFPNHVCLLRNVNVAKAAVQPGPKPAACTSTPMSSQSSGLKEHAKIWLAKRLQNVTRSKKMPPSGCFCIVASRD